MREIHVDEITRAIKEMAMEANYHLENDTINALKSAREKETSPTGKEILLQIIDNATIAATEEAPMCQDTGLGVVFAEVGQDVHIVGGNLKDAINEGIRRGYGDGFLRKSVVRDPFDRVNTQDNTPGVIHYEVVPGDKVTMYFSAKGGGSENMGEVQMLKPADGIEGVKKFVVERVFKSGGNPCPPIIVGVGIGGNFEMCAKLAKKSLFREIGSVHPNPFYAKLEDELLEEINKLGVGPMGLGGLTTALDVFIETAPCHIVALPVGVNIQCHANRHRSVVL